jgi:hypothetical protein
VHRTDGEKPKVPHAIGGYKLQWSIPANWINFIDAKKAYMDGLKLPDGHKCKFEGLGYFISREKDAKLDVYAVDLDKCLNKETGEIAPWAKDLLTQLDSYSEVSPSGTGVHVFVKGMLPEGSKNTNDQMKDKNRVEVFTNKHHITITGNRLEEYPSTIEDRSHTIEAIYNEVLEVKAAKKKEIKQDKVKKSRVIYDGEAEAKKKYVAAAIEDEISILASTSEGSRNKQLNESAFSIGQFVGAHLIGRHEAERALSRAARSCNMDEAKDGIEATIKSGLDAGEQNPRKIPDNPLPEQKTLPEMKIVEEKIKISPALIESESPKKEAIANVLVKLAIKNSFELWHTVNNDAYITVPVNNHKEHYKLSSKSRAIRIWLGRVGSDYMDKTVGGSTIKDVINVLEGKAIYDGKEYELHIRKAQYDNKIYVDMGDAAWTVIEISKDGWKIIKECDVKFKRSKNMLPLPMPERGGEIDDLKDLINATNEENWILTLAWLTQAFWCRGPYAHLYLRGPQGTMKSYIMKILKTISDPSAAIKRNLTNSEQDTAIALGSESITCFDNLSGIIDRLADLFCIASTGGVSAKRALYTDDEESVIRMKCAILMNGIDDLGQRGDLLDRTIVLDLEKAAFRKTEKEIDAEIEEKKSKLLGALLDMTAQGLENIDSIELEDPPRMADFASWACACLDGAAKRFMEIYTESRTNSSIDLADLNRLPSAIYSFVRNRPDKMWKGSASLLLADINHYAGIRPGYELEGWPTTPDKMGSELRRFSPSLETKGIFTTYAKSNGKRIIVLTARDPSGPEDTPIDTLPKEGQETLRDTRASTNPLKEKGGLKGNKDSGTLDKENLLAKHSDPRGPVSTDNGYCSDATWMGGPGEETLGKIEMETPTEKQSTFVRVLARLQKGTKPVTPIMVRIAMSDAGYDLSANDIKELMAGD